ncbi:hypothetical protein [Vulcanisaeta sp. JCM 14467]|uniref:hypothetical protein n=1 Tax=Vulcanisaeta sp. JCM 14467 TaxID=1295370 RepID=UPI000AF14776|nr:hypothetical protein [Vulcanisaeta sp. JCM 14467]
MIYAFWHYFQRIRDYDLLREVYDVITRAANFMVNFRDEKLKLPLESYDLWRRDSASTRTRLPQCTQANRRK